MSVACIIIAGGKRTRVLDELIIPSVLDKGFKEVVVVGKHHDGAGYRYLLVPDMLHNTVDALVKRDVGTLATTSSYLFYLCDDHAITRFEGFQGAPYVPDRWCKRDSQYQPLNSGAAEGYCGGHAGLFSRALIQKRPWTTMPHHPNWDVLATGIQLSLGATLWYGDLIIVEDVTPETQPWR